MNRSAELVEEICVAQGRGYRADGKFYDSDGEEVQITHSISTATQEDMMDFLNE